MIPTPLALALLALLAGAHAALAQEPEAAPPRAFLEDGPAVADRAFAARAAEAGVNEAFLEVLTPDGVLFRPHPVEGGAWMEANPDGGVLAWEPRAETVSGDGLLGVTLGTFTYALGGQVLSAGHYVSVWERSKDQPWGLVADIGAPHAPASSPLPYELFALQPGPRAADRAAVEASRRSLRELEQEWSAEASEGREDTTLGRATDARTVLLRPGPAPVFGPDAEQCRAQRSWHRGRKVETGVSRVLVAGSADLAVTWGDLRLVAAGQAARDPEPARKPRGGWLRVWSKGSDEGAWRVLAEVVLPMP